MRRGRGKMERMKRMALRGMLEELLRVPKISSVV